MFPACCAVQQLVFPRIPLRQLVCQAVYGSLAAKFFDPWIRTTCYASKMIITEPAIMISVPISFFPISCSLKK